MESLQYTSFNTTEVNHSNIQKYFLDDKKNYHCTFPACGKVFKFKSEMSRHAVIHYESRPFTCPYEGCNKNFKRSDALDTHIRLHTKENPFVCEEPDCGMSFVTKAALKYHVLKHNNERAFKCTFPGCTKTFFTKGQLRQHEKSYSYHVNLVGYKMMRKDVHATVVYPQDTQGYYTEFFPTVPELVQNIQWETKNPEEADEAIHYKQELVQETEVQLPVPVPVQETPVVIKDEINLDVKISEGLEEQQPNLSLALNEDWIESMKEPAIFFDEDEFKVLEFFRDYSFRGY